MGYCDCSMSNDDYKTSLLNYSHFNIPSAALINNYYYTTSTNNNLYPPKFQINSSEKYPKSTSITPATKKISYQTYNGDDSKITNNNNNNNNSNNITDKRVIDSQLVPMNLITNTGLDLSHSVAKSTTTTFETYLNSESLIHCYNNNSNNNNYYYLNSSPCSSKSPSIDVENDDCADRTMSPVSIPSYLEKPILNDTRNTSQSAFANMELTAGSIPSGFPLNFQQLYANNAALYGAPVMFSGAIHAAHASYMSGLPLHATLSPNETYLKAIQAAACGVYSPTALAPPPPPPPPPQPPSSSASVIPPLITAKPTALHNAAGGTMVALAPTSQPATISKSPHQAHQAQQQYSPNIVNGITEIKQQQLKKKDYHLAPLTSQTAVRTNASNNTTTTGTYLNDKVNERLTGVGATKDSHFKVPNGKEGSLKHRILRPSSNSDTEQVKTPVMRTYSSSTNFKRGNYIELANGTLRRVEDMRTEDFIQCAERSPNHQLAESTVVKVNTSLPTSAVITFSYDKNRSKVDMEVSLDHPFFVYGQGWASCNPEMSMKMFGLKCQRLQVGDICISLRKREQTKQQPVQPVAVTHSSQNSPLASYNETVGYQTRHTATIPSANAANLKPAASLPPLTSSTDNPFSAALNAHSFSIPVPQPAAAHHLQQQQLQHHQVQQQAYAEMAKIMSSYAYAKGLPHEQLKEVVMDANIMQSLPPKMMSAFYQNQIFQLAQQQHQQQQQQHEHLRQQHELKNSQQRVVNPLYTVANLNPSLSPQPCELASNHLQHQPPQTQPLDVTMSRKRRWSAPENMFDDDETETQPPRNGPSPSTART